MLFLVAILIGFLFYHLITKNHDYFMKRGLPYERPCPLLGNQWLIHFGKLNYYEYYNRFYNLAKPTGVGGIFETIRPAYLIADPELVKSITVKDFDHFMNHFDFTSPDDFFSKGLPLLKDNKWKDVRSILSPAFTGNKMRIMFELIEKCALKLEKYLQKEYEKGKGQVVKREVKDLISRFTNDAIATTAFGIEVDSLNDPQNEFFLMGKDLLDFTSGFRWLKMLFIFLAPKLIKIIFGEGILPSKPLNFFQNIFLDNINSRREKGIIRPDMIHLMLEATKEERERRKNQHSEVLTDEEMLAQAIIFFFGGFDTISQTLTFALHHLAEYPEIQERVYEEIENTLEENNGKINYDILMKMKYLDMFLNESQRALPVFIATQRECSKRYTIAATENRPELTIEPGDMIVIPPYCFHNDPEYFPNPEKLDPERFSEENKSRINPYAFFPFGIGPRSCIANRFAKMEMKLVLFYILKSLEIVFIEETEHPMKFSNRGNGVTSDKGFWLGFKPRNKKAL